MMVWCVLAVVLLTFLIWPVWAQEASDANLITAIDLSGSIKEADEHLEFGGIAAAVPDPRFRQAIGRGRHGPDRLRRLHVELAAAPRLPGAPS